ncbi:MAG TPA: CHAT domain-containing protein, partial [Pyrinomonadaceae bacterium]|nr:CHAT domain-containing protein [Pyrinomonadaceae bacterium]
RANLAAGSPEAALSSIRRSLEIIEDLRANEASPDFRVSYLSGVRKHYELCIEILMQLDRLRPGKGLAAEALLVSEKGRARLLLDLVSESQATLRQGAARELLDRERELRSLFGAQAQYRMDLLLSKKDSEELAAIDNQLAQLRAEYQEIQARIRQQHPRLFSLQEPLNLQQIQNELRAGDTMLLEYALGDERSYLWAVTSNSIQSYELASRVRIEEAARDFYKTLTARQGSVDKNYQANVQAADDAYLEKATQLSQMLLGPLAGQLGNKRLIVVTEGALQHIPLDALPEPGRSETFMIEYHEVVVLPSVSALIAIRGARNRTSSPNKVLAVIADPVFSSNDDRVQSGPVSRGVAQAAGDQKPRRRDGQLARLTYASEEADAISAVAPWGTTLVAKGFEATRETAMSSDIGQYQILHLATHGFLNSDHPELSGIVLSTVDSNGNETNGVMPLHDIYSLDLSAELTVLSACQTALGKDIRGEGLVGLTHSFMSAGSNSVVASLWKVDDRATAILMADFYESMLQQGMSPAAALRSAKLKLMKDKNWNAPYYWAGFVFQGEYTNRIAVARRSWFVPGLALFSLLVVAAAAFLIYRRRKQRPGPAQPA